MAGPVDVTTVCGDVVGLILPRREGGLRARACVHLPDRAGARLGHVKVRAVRGNARGRHARYELNGGRRDALPFDADVRAAVRLARAGAFGSKGTRGAVLERHTFNSVWSRRRRGVARKSLGARSAHESQCQGTECAGVVEPPWAANLTCPRRE